MMRSFIMLTMISISILHSMAQDGDRKGETNIVQDDKRIASPSDEDQHTARSLTDKASAQGSSGSGMKKNLRSDKYFPRNEEEKERWQERLLRWREEHHLNNPPKQMKSTDRKMFRAFKPYGHHVKNRFRKRLSTTQSKRKQVLY
uniref:Uncharacterized protein LOC111105413 n=1 Tax=Crassostrea virginica TaxID=6565 RepID=A0A8B8AXF3_CRAVI|nr:uncharacterized protein LOC111105413 [Crassostrea virginica]